MLAGIVALFGTLDAEPTLPARTDDPDPWASEHSTHSGTELLCEGMKVRTSEGRAQAFVATCTSNQLVTALAGQHRLPQRARRNWQGAMPAQRLRVPGQARGHFSPEKITVTCESPVGDVSVVTLIRTDTTLDHSQKAEKVYYYLTDARGLCTVKKCVWRLPQAVRL